MKKSEVKVGGVYRAKVTDKVVSVRIDGKNQHGGWDATNLKTKRKVHIKSAQRLRSDVKGKKALAAMAKSTPRPDRLPGEAVAEAGRQNRRKASDDKKGAKESQPKKEPKPKRVSALDAAAEILRKAGQPMRSKELIAAMAEQGLWSSPKGKTPHATLYAAMMREARDKGSASRFRKIDRGQFAFNGKGA